MKCWAGMMWCCVLFDAKELEWREAEEVEWGDVLRVTQRAMWASRRFLWEEAARNVGSLLACPAAWDGDHFLQVSTHRHMLLLQTIARGGQIKRQVLAAGSMPQNHVILCSQGDWFVTCIVRHQLS